MPRNRTTTKTPKFRRTFIKTWREFKNLNQMEVTTQIEELIGENYSDSKLSRIESGLQAYDQKTLEALSVVYQCSVYDLISRDPRDEHDFLSVYESLSHDAKKRMEKFAMDLKSTESIN